MSFKPHEHWKKIYAEKDTQKVSWYQAKPHESIAWIEDLKLDPYDPILDVGGGDSRLVDYLYQEGYQDIRVLDISAQALGNSQKRLGDAAAAIQWIHSNVLDFRSESELALWHDRAAFHFLRDQDERNSYRQIAAESIKSGGYLVIATFSADGPLKCSGLEIQRYSEEEMQQQFEGDFQVLKQERLLHETPAGGKQEFLFSLFQRS